MSLSHAEAVDFIGFCCCCVQNQIWKLEYNLEFDGFEVTVYLH